MGQSAIAIESPPTSVGYAYPNWVGHSGAALKPRCGVLAAAFRSGWWAAGEPIGQLTTHPLNTKRRRGKSLRTFKQMFFRSFWTCSQTKISFVCYCKIQSRGWQRSQPLSRFAEVACLAKILNVPAAMFLRLADKHSFQMQDQLDNVDLATFIGGVMRKVDDFDVWANSLDLKPYARG
jgi:hypothetical protein